MTTRAASRTGRRTTPPRSASAWRSTTRSRGASPPSGSACRRSLRRCARGWRSCRASSCATWARAMRHRDLYGGGQSRRDSGCAGRAADQCHASRARLDASRHGARGLTAGACLGALLQQRRRDRALLRRAWKRDLQRVRLLRGPGARGQPPINSARSYRIRRPHGSARTIAVSN